MSEPMQCSQTLRLGEDCCTAYDERCSSEATWHRAEDGVGLCEVHIGNARTLGGSKLGYWMVADQKYSYPDGWTRISDGTPLVDGQPAELKPSPEAEDPKVRPSGLVLP